MRNLTLIALLSATLVAFVGCAGNSTSGPENHQVEKPSTNVDEDGYTLYCGMRWEGGTIDDLHRWENALISERALLQDVEPWSMLPGSWGNPMDSTEIVDFVEYMEAHHSRGEFKSVVGILDGQVIVFGTKAGVKAQWIFYADRFEIGTIQSIDGDQYWAFALYATPEAVQSYGMTMVASADRVVNEVSETE